MLTPSLLCTLVRCTCMHRYLRFRNGRSLWRWQLGISDIPGHSQPTALFLFPRRCITNAAHRVDMPVIRLAQYGFDTQKCLAAMVLGPEY